MSKVPGLSLSGNRQTKTLTPVKRESASARYHPAPISLLARVQPNSITLWKIGSMAEIASKEKTPPRKVLILLPPPPVSNKVMAAPTAEKRLRPQYIRWKKGLQ